MERGGGKKEECKERGGGIVRKIKQEREQFLCCSLARCPGPYPIPMYFRLSGVRPVHARRLR